MSSAMNVPPVKAGSAIGMIAAVSIGIGGMVGPLMFGFAMDQGAPQWVFGISVILMIAVAVVALIGDRRAESKRRQRVVQAAASAD